jgi:hypothetical protein
MKNFFTNSRPSLERTLVMGVWASSERAPIFRYICLNDNKLAVGVILVRKDSLTAGSAVGHLVKEDRLNRLSRGQ